MKIGTDDLIKIYRSHIQEQIPRLRKQCLSTERIMQLFTTSGSRVRKRRIVDHLTGCQYCAKEFGFFLEIYREEGILFKEISCLLPKAEQFQAANKRTPFAKAFFWLDGRYSRPFRRVTVAFLLAIVVVSAIILTTRQSKMTQKDMERGKTPGQFLFLSPARGQILRTPLVFKWKLAGKFDYAILEIFDEALSPIWKSPRVEEDSYQLPLEIEAKIEKNKTYYWMITIFLVDSAIIESPLENFKLIE